MKQKYILLISLLWASCQYEKKVFPEANELRVAQDYPYVIDTFNIPTAEREASWLGIGSYHILYIGKEKDTLVIDYNIRNIQPPPPLHQWADSLNNQEREIPDKSGDYYLPWDDNAYFKNWNESLISIRLDTSTFIRNKDEEIDWENAYFRAYPVFLINKEVDTVAIGYGDYLPLIMEAQDSTGLWRPIEEKQSYFCGLGIGTIILPPEELVLTSAIVYHGEFKTKLRLKMGDNYSHPFSGAINYRQFLDIFDKNGNYRQEYLDERAKKAE